MRKIFTLFTLAFAIGLSSCKYDDTDLWNAVNDQEERIAALEEWQQTTNNNLTALQTLINTMDYITSVSPILQSGDTIGYTINFYQSDPISIYNGTTSEIGVTQDADGNWLWTIDGEVLTDADGNPIQANGQDAAAPKLSVGQSLLDEDITTDAEGEAIIADVSYLSVDGGKTWYRVTGEKGDKGDTGATGPQGPSGSSGTNGDSFFEDVKIEGAYVVFTLKGGAKFSVPYQGGTLAFALGGVPLNDLSLPIDLTKGELTYTAPTGMQVSVRILEGEGWSVIAENGTITISSSSLNEALLEVTLLDNGRVIETYRLTLTLYNLSGSGTEDDPYQISTAQEFEALELATADTYFELIDDIDLGNAEIMIATFAGTLDGKGYTVRNFNIQDDAEYNHIGLFRVLEGTIRNLKVKGTVHKVSKASDQVSSIHVIGGIIGYNNGGTVENCTFSGKVISDVNDVWDYIGGVVGYNVSGGIVKGCAHTGEIVVKRAQATGGVVGMNGDDNDNDSYVIGCYNTGNIQYENVAGLLGGVVGSNWAYTVACYNTGTITVPTGGQTSSGIGHNISGHFTTACYSVLDAQTSSDVCLIATYDGSTGTDFNTCYWLEAEGRIAIAFYIGYLNTKTETKDNFTDCSAKSETELKSQETVNALNAAITTWNSSHNNLCTYQFAVDPNGGYPILQSQE